MATKQLQLERDPLVPLGRIYLHKAGLDGRDEVVPHLLQVVDVALENLEAKKSENEAQLGPGSRCLEVRRGDSCSREAVS